MWFPLKDFSSNRFFPVLKCNLYFSPVGKKRMKCQFSFFFIECKVDSPKKDLWRIHILGDEDVQSLMDILIKWYPTGASYYRCTNSASEKSEEQFQTHIVDVVGQDGTVCDCPLLWRQCSKSPCLSWRIQDRVLSASILPASVPQAIRLGLVALVWSALYWKLSSGILKGLYQFL